MLLFKWFEMALVLVHESSDTTCFLLACVEFLLLGVLVMDGTCGS